MLSIMYFTFQSGSIQMATIYKSHPTPFIFTFQSGSIQIVINNKNCAYVLPLHSNLVLFKWCTPPMGHMFVLSLHSNLVLFKSNSAILNNYVTQPLHSNLVLFKWVSSESIYARIMAFTFQSGSIQINDKFIQFKKDNFFTFQSGSIQM